MKQYLSPFYFALTFVTIVSVILLQFPLFNVLDIEFAIVISPLVAFFAALLTLRYYTPPISLQQFRLYIIKVTGLSLVLSLIPMLLALGNAFFIKNCSIQQGLYYYSIIVIPAILYSIGLAVCCAVLSLRWKTIIYIFLFTVHLVYIPFMLYFSPQVFVFNPIIGVFPGFLYDETPPVLTRLPLFRLFTLVAATTLIAFALWLWNIYTSLKERSTHTTQRVLLELIIIAVSVPFLITMFLFSDTLGFSSSETFIKRKLGGLYKSTHVDIVYPLGKVSENRLKYIANLHDYYYNELSTVLMVTPRERIITYLYTTDEQKARFLGTTATNFAKPWLSQLHITLDDIEHGLKHEMVHIFAREFGWSPLRVGRSFGVTEGIAVALGNELYFDEPLSKAAAMILMLQPQLSVKDLFTTKGFFDQPTTVAYTMSGAFCQYLISTYGTEPFKVLYRTNDFSAAFNKSAKELEEEWKNTLQNYRLTNEDSLKALFWFSRTPITKKECYRSLGALLSEARTQYQQQDYENAIETVNKLLILHPTPEAIRVKAYSLFGLRRFSEFIELVTGEIESSRFAHLYMPLYLRTGDAYLGIDSVEKARNYYFLLSRLHLSLATDEASACRLEALSLPTELKEWQTLFTYTLEDTVILQRLQYLTSPLSNYYKGKLYFSKNEYRKALQSFQAASGMKYKSLEFFRWYYVGLSNEYDFRFSDAIVAFRQALLYAQTDGMKLETNRHIQRCIEWNNNYSDEE